MGSIEVYDAKQEKWVPYVPDYNAWYQHFKDLRDGYVQPNHMGRYVVGSGKKYRKLKEIETREKEMEACEKKLNWPTSSLGTDSCPKLYAGWDSYSLESIFFS